MSACTFGVLLAVMLAPAAVARADQTDQDFNNFVQSHGVNLGTPAFNVKAAHTMCQDLDAGYTEGRGKPNRGSASTELGPGPDVRQRGHRGLLPATPPR